LSYPEKGECGKRKSVRILNTTSVMDGLGLNDHHKETVVNYMRFARYQRTQRLRAIDSAFDEVRDSRLVDDTYTLDEVQDLLDGLQDVIKGDVDTELIHTAHTNILLLRQLFAQAEKWHLKLQADISELENVELLGKIKEMEEREMSKGVKKSGVDSSLKFSKLEPIQDGGADKLLQTEIARLNQENAKLRDRLKSTEQKTSAFLEEKSKMRDQLEKLQQTMKNHRGDGDTGELERQMKQLRLEMEKTQSSSAATEEQLGGELTSAKHQLLEVREQLEMAEQELEKKFSQTGAYQNMKKMLSQKNNQIKDLRKRLTRYEDNGGSSD